MKFSKNFNGWLGKIADDFTYKKMNFILINLCDYYKTNSTAGQKLVVGYDGRFLSKEFAEYAACFMANQGIKVFLSNKEAPSSVLVIAAGSKKSLGTITITGDEHDMKYLGIRAYDSNGHFLNDECFEVEEYQNPLLSEKEFNLTRFVNKRFIEYFDPGINYGRYIDSIFDFSTLSNHQKIFFNPVFGASQFYFDCFLFERLSLTDHTGLNGYTINNNQSTCIDEFKTSSFSLSSQNTQFAELLLEHSCDIGIMISPDASRFETYFKVEKDGEIKVKRPSTTELISILSHYFTERNIKGKIILSESLSVRKNELEKLPFDVSIVKEKEFYSEIKNNEFVIAIDSFKRFYLLNLKTFDALTTCFMIVTILNQKSFSNKQQMGGHLE